MAVKKQWYEIIAPKMFGEKVVGETLAADPKQLIGRKINVSLMDMSRDFAKFYLKMSFRVVSVEGMKAYTKFVGHDIMRERIFRMVQRRLRRVDCVQDVTTKDGQKLRVKTVFVLAKRVGTSLKDATRKKCREVVEKAATENTLEDFVKLIIAGEVQNRVKQDCYKIYPIGGIEIRKSELFEEKKTGGKAEEAPEAKEAAAIVAAE